MTQYVYLSDENIVSEIIPEYVDTFPGIPVTERYAPDFLAKCKSYTQEEFDAKGVALGKMYYPETNEYQDPPELPEPEPTPEPAPTPLTPSEYNQLVDENNRLKAQVTMLEAQHTFLEDCILEMANVVYA